MAPPKVKTAHVNMMTDTIIANLSLEGLRAVMRGVLSSHPAATPVFEEQTRSHLNETAAHYQNLTLFEKANDTGSTASIRPEFKSLRRRVCCMVGCGMCYQALPLLEQIVRQLLDISFSEEDSLYDEIAAVDGDVVQALTAIQKTLLSPTGSRELTPSEAEPIAQLRDSVLAYRANCTARSQIFVLERATDALDSLLQPDSAESVTTTAQAGLEVAPQAIPETFTLDGLTLPRIFTGLWQLSSPAWGSASRTKMMEQFSSYVARGFTAFDMADHYGDAEIIFGRYRSSSAYSDKMFAAT
ncbi:hypothetical protein BJX64DRAFT_295322, partial [Aspergillus heterothallicus]